MLLWGDNALENLKESQGVGKKSWKFVHLVKFWPTVNHSLISDLALHRPTRGTYRQLPNLTEWCLVSFCRVGWVASEYENCSDLQMTYVFKLLNFVRFLCDLCQNQDQAGFAIWLSLPFHLFVYHYRHWWMFFFDYRLISLHPLFPQNIHHRSCGDRLEGKGENYQVCSVQYCVQQLCTVRCRHIWTD